MKRTDRQAEARFERLADALPKAIEPARDLWPGIEARLEADRRLSAGPPAGLPREIEPERDLWPGIAARLEGVSTRRSGPVLAFPRFGLAAAVGLFAVAATLFALQVRMQDLASTPVAATSADTAWWLGGLSASAARDPSGPIGQAFADASRSLYRDYEMVREQRLAIEAAMREAPGDSSLRSLWRHAYKTELELIDRAHRLDTDYRRRIES